MVFDSWTVKDMTDQGGKIAIVTGANSGIGFETAKVLAQHNAAVILACRDEKKGLKAAQKINKSINGGHGKAIYMHLDLGKLSSVYEFVAAFHKMESETDGLLRILVNNAGVGNIKPSLTSDGLEYMHQVNYFGPFLLTHLLTEKLVANAPSRVVTCTSDATLISSIDWDDLRGTKLDTSVSTCYARTKLLDHMFAVELNRRLSDSGVESFAVHPGFTESGMSTKFVSKIGDVFKYFLQSTSDGALSTIFCASSDAVQGKGGALFGPSLLMVNNTAECSPRNRLAVDANACNKLWKETEEILELESAVRLSLHR